MNWNDSNGHERKWGPMTVRITLGDVIQLCVLLVTMVWFAAGYGADIRSLHEWRVSHEKRTEELRAEYEEEISQLQRQDVLEAKLDKINFRLERIENRLGISPAGLK